MKADSFRTSSQNDSGAKPEHPNTVSGLVAKRDELVRLRKKLDEEYRAVGLDIDHLEAAIRVFDPDNTPEARKRYAALHRAPKGQSRRFILQALRDAKEPLTSRRLAEMWCAHRGLDAKDATMVMLRKRIGATLVVAHNAGFVRQNGFVDGMIGWEISSRVCEPAKTKLHEIPCQ